MSSKLILVLGCNGQDGSLISHSLLKQGHSVIGLTRSKPNSSNNLSKLGIEKDIKIETGKIEDHKRLLELFEKYQPEEVYNLASQSSVGRSFSEPSRTIESIVNGTLNTLEICREINYSGRLFFAGSSEMFGETQGKADINHVQKPNNPYAVAKQTSFKLVELYREIYKLNCVTGVLFNHESPLRTKDFVTQKIIDGAIKTLKDKSHRIKLGNIEISRDWGWAEEYVEAMQVINRSKELKDHVICSGRLTSLREFLSKSYQALGLNWEEHVEINSSLKRETDIKTSVGNPLPLYNSLNWKAEIKIDKVIELLINKKMKVYN